MQALIYDILIDPIGRRRLETRRTVNGIVFHGGGWRGAKTLDVAESLAYGHTPYLPMRLWRSGAIVPHVFSPGRRSHIVVSEDVKNALVSLHNIDFCEVEWEKIIDINADYNDRQFDKWWTEQYIRCPSDPFGTTPDNTELRAKIGRYFEIVVPIYSDVCCDWRLNKTLQYEDRSEGLQTYTDALGNAIMVSDEFMRAYPMLRAGGIIFNEAAFEIISAYWDPAIYASIAIADLV